MLTQQPYYTPSGKFSVGGLITMTVFGTLAAAALSVAYGYLTTYNPFIYFNILATFGFGFVMGLAASMGASMGKIRNSAIASLIAVLVGFMGVYFSWVVWLYASSGQADEAMLVLDPIALFAILDHLAQQGVWSLKSWTPRGETLYAVERGVALLQAEVATQAHTLGVVQLLLREEGNLVLSQSPHEGRNGLLLQGSLQVCCSDARPRPLR